MERDSLPMRDYEAKDVILKFMLKRHDAFITSREIEATFNEENDVDIHRVRALLAELRSVSHVVYMNRHRPNVNMITPLGITFIRDKGGYTEWAKKEALRLLSVEVEKTKEKRRKKWEAARDWVFGGMILILTVLQILQITGVL